jgi:hypothetical protein
MGFGNGKLSGNESWTKTWRQMVGFDKLVNVDP